MLMNVRSFKMTTRQSLDLSKLLHCTTPSNGGTKLHTRFLHDMMIFGHLADAALMLRRHLTDDLIKLTRGQTDGTIRYQINESFITPLVSVREHSMSYQVIS